MLMKKVLDLIVTPIMYIYSKSGKNIELKKDRKDRIANKILDWVIEEN